MMKTGLATLAAASSLAAGPIIGDQVEGVATIQDGDGLVLVGYDDVENEIRLYGIDAPELFQLCWRADGTAFGCGKVASAFLEQWVAGYWVRCVVKDLDRHDRPVAQCTHEGLDIGEQIVGQGYARAYTKYSRLYADTEKAARREARGFWSGSWDAPWNYRRQLRQGHSRK